MSRRRYLSLDFGGCVEVAQCIVDYYWSEVDCDVGGPFINCLIADDKRRYEVPKTLRRAEAGGTSQTLKNTINTTIY